jgi:hypothetical protein
LSTRLISRLRLAVSPGFVLFGVGGDVFQCPLDGLRDGRRCGQVGPLRDKAVLVGRVREADASAIWSSVLIPSLGKLDFLLRIAEVLHVTFFLSLYFVGCLIAATFIIIIIIIVVLVIIMNVYYHGVHSG